MIEILTKPCPCCGQDIAPGGDPREILTCICGAMLKTQEPEQPFQLVGFRINPEDR